MNTDETNFDVLETGESIIEQTEKIIKQYDVVNNPSHYTDSKIEVIDYIEDKNLGFCLGNVIKYVSRAGKKVDSDNIIYELDKCIKLNKARWYANQNIFINYRLIELLLTHNPDRIIYNIEDFVLKQYITKMKHVLYRDNKKMIW